VAKYLPAVASLIAAMLLASSPSEAYEGPWCASVGMGTGNIREICHFRSFAECQAEVISGTRGICSSNPRYAGGGSEGRPAKHKPRHHRD
jgi:hypothetical protein